MALLRSKTFRALAAASLVAAGALLVLQGSSDKRRAAKATVPPTSTAKAGKSAKKSKAAPPPAAARLAIHPQPSEVLVRAEYGSAPGELGKINRSEGAPEGPMSFAVGADRRVHVLDQINSRIQVFGAAGEKPRVIDLPSDTFQDIAIDARGNDVVLDRLVTGVVAFMNEKGDVDHTVPVVGPNIPEGGAVTALFTRPDGVWLEVEHGDLVRIATADGEPDPHRSAVNGRFGHHGRSAVHAAIAAQDRIAVISEALEPGGPSFHSEVTTPLSILGLHALDTDDAGNTVVVANLIREDQRTFDVIEERETAFVLDAQGREVAQVELAPPEGPEEQLNPIRVGADGSIYQLALGKDAATVERFAR